MNLDPTEEQRELVELARRILTDATHPHVLRERDRAGVTQFDRMVWTNLAEAGLLGTAIPEEHGGLGFGFLETCLVLEEVGRTTAPVPALTVLGAAVPALVRYGTPEQRAALLKPIGAGSLVASAALTESGGDPFAPRTTATATDGWTLNGVKTGVPAGTEAEVLLVAARAEGLGPRLFVVDAATPGVTVVPQPTVSGELDAEVRLDGVRLSRAAILGGPEAGDTVRATVQHAMVASCAVVAGVTAAAVELTAEYVKGRHAFGRPLATFQAVGQQTADAFTSAWTVRLAAREAAWALADGRPADAEVLTAKYIAAAQGSATVRMAQHLHGGIGLDADYPVHRYTAWAKRWELGLGGASEQLERLGDLIAEGTAAR